MRARFTPNPGGQRTVFKGGEKIVVLEIRVVRQNFHVRHT